MTEAELKAAYRKFVRYSLTHLRDLNAMRSVMKTDAGRFTPAGKAFVKEALQGGLPQATIARLLAVTPPAISYYAH